jgi:integrase
LRQDEIERILLALGCDPQVTPVTETARVGFAWLFAIETAMRAGEIVGLRWADINGAVAKLHMTKNGEARDVPLSVEAVRLLNFLPRGKSDDTVFQIDSHSLDALWRKGRDRALVEDLHFHDARREALTRLSKKLPVMELAAVSGHLDLRILMKTYYAPDAADIATRMG